MKVLVFGAGGQVGGALIETAPSWAELIPVARVHCDVRRRFAVEQVIGEASPGIVINAAAYTAVDRAEVEPHQANVINSLAPGWMAAASRKAGAKFVHLSSDFVFDGSNGTPYLPADLTAPLSVYGSTKLDGERAVTAADGDALIIRTSWVYSGKGRNFVTSMLNLMQTREQINVVVDQIGTPTYAPALAGCIWRLARLDTVGIHHVSDAGVASWYDFAVAIQEEAIAVGYLKFGIPIIPIRTEDYPTAARRPHYSVLDQSATWAALGGPGPHWRSNLRTCLEGMCFFNGSLGS